MQTVNTRLLLETLTQQTSLLLDEAIQKWQMMPAEKFSSQPSEIQWSAKQCFAHLNAYGNYYIPAIQKAINNARIKKQLAVEVFTHGWVGNYFTRLMQPGKNGLPAKKMKAFRQYISANNEDGYKVIAEFIDQQEKMLKLIEQAAAINLNTTKVAVSIAPFIKLKLGDVFMFITAHNFRHLKQAERAAGVPATTISEKSDLFG